MDPKEWSGERRPGLPFFSLQEELRLPAGRLHPSREGGVELREELYFLIREEKKGQSLVAHPAQYVPFTRLPGCANSGEGRDILLQVDLLEH